MDAAEHAARFVNYPEVKETVDVPFEQTLAKNPVLRGLTLAIAVRIIRASSLISGFLWKGNKFDDLCKIKEIENFIPKWEPTVIPIHDAKPTNKGSALPAEVSTSPGDLPPVPSRRSQNHHYTCGDYHELYISGKLTPRDVVDAILPLIRRDTSPPGEHHRAFISVEVDLIRKAADASTERYKQGKPLSMLDGVPFAVKDDAQIEGYVRHLGTSLNMSTPGAKGTEWSIQKLQDAGGVLLGQTNMHEMGIDVAGTNPTWGTPLNPHNNNYFCGGSSTGSAYAVSSGLVPIAHGADAAGSIRIPASFVGVYGLKTSHGRISRLPTVEGNPTECTTGPISSSIDDLALAYRVMGTPDPSNSQSRNFPHPSLGIPRSPSSSPSGTKYIGIPSEWLDNSTLHPGIQSQFTNLITSLSSSPNTKIIPLRIPHLPASHVAQSLDCLIQASTLFTTPSHPPSQLSSLSPQCQLMLSIPLGNATVPSLQAALKLRSLLMSHFAAIFTKYPGLIFLTPTTPSAGYPVASKGDVDGKWGFFNGDKSLEVMRFSWLANFIGTPCLTVPMGRVDPIEEGGRQVDKKDAGGIPVGVMAMGEWGAEEELMEWARSIEGGGEEGVEGVKRPEGEGRWVDVIALALEGKGKGKEEEDEAEEVVKP